MKTLKKCLVAICIMSTLLLAGVVSEASGFTHFMVTSTSSWGTRTLKVHFNPSINTWTDTNMGLVANRRVRQTGARLREGNRDTGWQYSSNITTNINQSYSAAASQFNNPLQVQTSNWQWIYR